MDRAATQEQFSDTTIPFRWYQHLIITQSWRDTSTGLACLSSSPMTYLRDKSCLSSRAGLDGIFQENSWSRKHWEAQFLAKSSEGCVITNTEGCVITLHTTLLRWKLRVEVSALHCAKRGKQCPWEKGKTHSIT